MEHHEIALTDGSVDLWLDRRFPFDAAGDMQTLRTQVQEAIRSLRRPASMSNTKPEPGSEIADRQADGTLSNTETMDELLKDKQDMSHTSGALAKSMGPWTEEQLTQMYGPPLPLERRSP